MIKQEEIQRAMLNLLQGYTGCVCVPSNTTKKMPAYPYISFSIINTDTKKGTYAKVEDVMYGVMLFNPLLQKWSFTVQSDNDAEAQEKAMLIKDFFEEAKRLELADNGIIVADVGAITPRDTLLTIEYEYRKGLDVTLRLNNVIADPITETVEKATLSSDKLGEINLEKES